MPHTLSGVSCNTISKCAGKSSSWRLNDGSNVEIRPLGAHLVTFEVAVAPNNSKCFEEIFVNEFLILWQTRHFKIHGIGSNWLDCKVCTRVSTLFDSAPCHTAASVRNTFFENWSTLWVKYLVAFERDVVSWQFRLS